LSTYIPDDKIAEIRESCNIVHLVSEYVPLKKYGANYKGLCPFHSENTPSFTVSEVKQIFHCFGCNAGGNIFTFLMKFEHLSFPEAAVKLAKKHGIDLPKKDVSPAQKRLAGEKEQLFTINEHAAAYYSTCLQSRAGERARNYLETRNISLEAAGEYRVGYALPSWNGLLTFLKKRGVSLELARTLGLIKHSKNSLYDCFRDRIIFPIINYNHRVIGFGSRTLGTDSAKYINSSDSLIYKKSHSLYGLNVALPSIRKEDSVILVEGNFDLISLHQYGIKNVVATLGTALTIGQIKLLKRFTRNVTIAFDTDEAGIKASIKSLALFLENGISPRILTLAPGVDPDEFIHREKETAFRQKLEQAPPLMEFYIKQVLKRKDSSTTEGSLSIIREMAPLVSKLGDITEKNLYIQKLSQAINVTEQVIRTEIATAATPAKPKQSEARDLPLKVSSQNRAEELLLQVIILHPEVIPQVKMAQIENDLKDPQLKRLMSFILKCSDTNETIKPDWLINNLEEEPLKHIVSKLVIKEDGLIDFDKTLHNCIQWIKTTSLKREIELLNTKIREAQAGKDESAIEQFLAHKQELLERKKEFTSDHTSIHLH
jgi:DNA primase